MNEWFPLHTATKCGSAETIRATIGCGIPIQPNRITTPNECISPRDVPEDQTVDSRPEDYSSDDDNEVPKQTNHRGDGDDPGDTMEFEDTMANMQDMLKQWRKFIGILFQNVEIKLPLSSGKSKDKFKIIHQQRYPGGPCQLGAYLSDLRSNF